MPDRFRHEEAERTIVFGAGALEAADDLLGSGYTLLTTPRAERAAPDVVERAGAVVHVPGGLVEDVAAALRPDVQGDRLVALGGGRVVDVAKALAAADGPREVLAIPTSLSAAEMTGSHRHARGVPADTPRVRPRMVVNDPALSASQPTDELAASTANALGHATVGLLSDRTTPIPRAVAREAIAHLVAGWSGPEPDRTTLALGALLAGWSIDHSGLGPHHALAQTLVRTAGLGHAQANAAVLPAAIAALRRRRAAELGVETVELGTPLEAFAGSLRERAGVRDFDGLDRLVETAAERAELARVAPPPDRDELREIYREAGASG